MYEFNHILLCLDIKGEMDRALLAYVQLLAGCFPIQTLDVLQVNSRDRKVSLSEIREKLSTSGLFDDQGNVNIHIKEGSPHKNILRHAKNEAADLVVIGRKKNNREALEMGKVVNAAPCSVLLIPEDAVAAIRKIVVAVDYSEQTLFSIQKARQIAGCFKAELIFAHVYHVPAGYHVSGKTYEEYAGIMEKNARTDADTFVKKHSLENLNFRSSFILDDNNEPSDRIFRFAVEENADLLCISSSGLDAFTDIFFNSTAEMLFKRDNRIPLLVAREHKKSKGFLEAVRDL